jgi:glucokinase
MDAPVLVADVGGTHARFALASCPTGTAAPALAQFRRYLCAEYSGLAEIARQFLHDAGERSVADAVIAIAGVVQNGVVVSSNLRWNVSVAQLRHALHMRSLALINDFEAVAYATPHIDPAAATLLCGPAPIAWGPTVVLGPGTGFGAAFWAPPRTPATKAYVLPSEAGHAAWAPGNPLEAEILAKLWQRDAHVDNERVLSGPGLVNVYRCICEIGGHTPQSDRPADIADAALHGRDTQAEAALHVFCGALGSLCGDLALNYCANTVLLAGGIPSQIGDFLRHSEFAARYLNKGGLRDVLQRVPALLVEHGSLGLLGAAAWYLDRRDDVATSAAA